MASTEPAGGEAASTHCSGGRGACGLCEKNGLLEETRCGHTFCSDCMTTSIRTSQECPIDCEPLNAGESKPDSQVDNLASSGLVANWLLAISDKPPQNNFTPPEVAPEQHQHTHHKPKKIDSNDDEYEPTPPSKKRKSKSTDATKTGKGAAENHNGLFDPPLSKKTKGNQNDSTDESTTDAPYSASIMSSESVDCGGSVDEEIEKGKLLLQSNKTLVQVVREFKNCSTLLGKADRWDGKEGSFLGWYRGTVAPAIYIARSYMRFDLPLIQALLRRDYPDLVTKFTENHVGKVARGDICITPEYRKRLENELGPVELYVAYRQSAPKKQEWAQITPELMVSICKYLNEHPQVGRTELAAKFQVSDKTFVNKLSKAHKDPVFRKQLTALGLTKLPGMRNVASIDLVPTSH